MLKRPLGKTGFDVSVLGFGAAPAAFLKAERELAAAIIGGLLDAGVNLIDTAMLYPGSHEFIGEHLSPRRKDFVLVSKCGPTIKDIDLPRYSPALIHASIDRALTHLRTDSIDVMLLHSPDLLTLQQGEALGTLLQARDAGKIKFAGVSADNETAAYACALPNVSVVETSISIVDQANIEKVLPWARKHEVGILAKRPIGNGFWKGTEGQQGMYKNYVSEYVRRFGLMGLKASELASTDSDWAEVALRFTVSLPEVTCAIVGTTNADNARRNLAIAEKGPLSLEQIATIRNKFAKAEGSDAWTGQN